MATAHRRLALVLFAVLVAQVVGPAHAGAQSTTFGGGRSPKPDELKAIDIEVMPDGRGLPPGSGTGAAGKRGLHTALRDVSRSNWHRRSAGCDRRRSGLAHHLTAAEDSRQLLALATTLWDYINRAMPFDHPSTLTSDEVYAATAYVLLLNHIVGEQDVLNQTTLPEVKMPNRNGFVADPRPDVSQQPATEPVRKPQQKGS